MTNLFDRIVPCAESDDKICPSNNHFCRVIVEKEYGVWLFGLVRMSNHDWLWETKGTLNMQSMVGLINAFQPQSRGIVTLKKLHYSTIWSYVLKCISSYYINSYIINSSIKYFIQQSNWEKRRICYTWLHLIIYFFL